MFRPLSASGVERKGDQIRAVASTGRATSSDTPRLDLSFDKFLLDKQAATAANHILIDGWTFAPRPGVYAEKVINGTCGEPAELPGRLAAHGPAVNCVERTTFTVRPKR